MHCRNRGSFHSIKVLDEVMDGTPCREGHNDVCIGGKCEVSLIRHFSMLLNGLLYLLILEGLAHLVKLSVYGYIRTCLSHFISNLNYEVSNTVI